MVWPAPEPLKLKNVASESKSAKESLKVQISPKKMEKNQASWEEELSDTDSAARHSPPDSLLDKILTAVTVH